MSAGLSFSGGGGDSRLMIPFSPSSSSFFFFARFTQTAQVLGSKHGSLVHTEEAMSPSNFSVAPYTGMGIPWSLHGPESQASARLLSDELYRRQSARAP